MWADFVKAMASLRSEIGDTDIWLLVTFPALLISGRRVIEDLARNVRAKKALENQVLLAVRSDVTAHAAIIAGKTHMTGTAIMSAAGQPPSHSKRDVTDVVTAAAGKLQGEDAAVVQRALKQGEYYERADYIDDIARHVTSKIVQSA
jgi:hypothetical protein